MLTSLIVSAQQTIPPKKASKAANPASPRQSTIEPTLSATAQEAAARFLNSVLIKCSGNEYVESVTGVALQAVDQPSVRVLPWSMTDADRLNGIDWIGELILTVRGSRDVQQSQEQASSQFRWRAALAKSHLVGEDARTGRADFEGACGRCVLIPNELESIGAYRSNHVWHFFKPDFAVSEGLGTQYTIIPDRGTSIDLDAIAAKKHSCSVIGETLEFREAERKATEAETEARRMVGLPAKSAPLANFAVRESSNVWLVTAEQVKGEWVDPTPFEQIPEPGFDLAEMRTNGDTHIPRGSLLIPFIGGINNTLFVGRDFPNGDHSYLCAVIGDAYNPIPNAYAFVSDSDFFSDEVVSD